MGISIVLGRNLCQCLVTLRYSCSFTHSVVDHSAVWLCGPEPGLTIVSGSLVWPLDGWLRGYGHLACGPGPSTDSLASLPSPDPELNLVVRPSLESLLAASSHMLKEVLESPFSDPLKNLRLPRELNSNKKYSWMQKKEERVSPHPLFLPEA